ncbi:hypothetical protein [Neotamlana sedimentorum]|uniref:hypothetical protein n=1 Tax=Neotamlana sedimentorum TaxID=1435349 RepID=UPI000AA9B278|nr:hypothetical protein [Tamlana sedimentorum]
MLNLALKVALERYNLSSQKDGFKDATITFNAYKGVETAYYKNLELHTQNLLLLR